MRKNPEQQQACWDAFSQNMTESSLSRHVIGTLHCNLLLPNDSLDRSTTLLWTLRNPVDRIVSWFHYMNPANCLPQEDYYSTACNTNRSIISTSSLKNKKGSKWPMKFFQCFPTLNHFAETLITQGDNESSSCFQIAWRTITGTASTASGHAYYNYRYYWNETIAKYPNKELWVLRTESLWDDMAAIETTLSPSDVVALSSSHPLLMKRNVTHGSEAHVQRDRLSNRGLARLCCALKDEIAIYANILQQSTNLEVQERKKPISFLRDQCLLAMNASTRNLAEMPIDLLSLSTFLCTQ